MTDSQNIITQIRRREANSWCEQVLGGNSVDFWRGDWRHLLETVIDAPKSLVLTADGGMGKSVLTAHLVRYLLEQDPFSCVVVLHRSDSLDGGIAAVRKLVGAESPDTLMRFVDTMRALNHRVLFVIDGLDSMTGATGTKVIADVLRELAETSCLFITCRTQLWNQEFSRLDIQPQQVPPLNLEVVQRILVENTPFGQRPLALLQNPLLLDAALKLSKHSMNLPTTETGLLGELLNTYREPHGAPPRRLYNFTPVLTRLAEMQLAAMSYEVPRPELLAALRDMDDGAEAVARLESGGILLGQASGVDATVRLSHDQLDCFNMACLLIGCDGAHRRRQWLYEHAADGVGWPLLSMLVQVAHDRSDDSVLREVFTELLRMLDRKRWDSTWMARSWAATYVLSGKLTELLPLMLECLDGEQVASLADRSALGGSRLDPHPCVTQEAASSLASAFAGLDDWRAGYPAQAIPVLSRGLQRWPLRKRFVEALGKYQDSAALDALTAFARTQLRPDGDSGLLGEIAEALGDIGRGFSDERREVCIAILEEIIAHADLNPRARRAAVTSKNNLTYPITEPVPDVGEEEIIANLSPLDQERQSYSDWRVIERYTTYAYDCIANGSLSQPLLDALLQAFTHESLSARVPVARCLGVADHPAARVALLAELLRPSSAWDVRKACLDALEAQISETSLPAARALRRWLVLDAADRAAASGMPAARSIADLVSKSQRADDGIITRTAFELLSAPVTASGNSAPVIDLLSPAAAPVADWMHAIVAAEDHKKVGEGHELKYRLVSASRGGNAELRASIVETTWEDGASFHNAMRREESHLRENADRMLSAWLSESAYLPGIVSVHCIVITGDSKIVETRRSASSLYAPGRWSISFEEQLTEVDIQSKTHDAATAAVLRGFNEEFKLPADGCRVRVLSAAVELPIISNILLAVVETSETSEAFRQAAGSLRSSDSQELSEINFIDALSHLLRTETRRADLHPTSAIRVLALSRLLGWPTD